MLLAVPPWETCRYSIENRVSRVADSVVGRQLPQQVTISPTMGLSLEGCIHTSTGRSIIGLLFIFGMVDAPVMHFAASP